MEILPRTPGRDPVTIVIAEDDDSLAEMLSITLQLEGFRVAIATDGMTALRIARDLRPEIVLLDVSIPRMDGLTVCRALRAGSRGDGPTVFMLSGRASEKDRTRCLDAGADLFLAKPFETTDLVAKIHAALQGSRPSRERDAMAAFEVRIEGLDTFGERYGDAQRDRVIRLASRILGAVAGVRPPVIVGNHGEHGFLLVTRETIAPDVCALAIDTFAACVAGLFDGEERTGSLAVSISPWSPGGGARVSDTRGRPVQSASLRPVIPLRRSDQGR